MKKSIQRYLERLHLPEHKTIVITGGNSGIGFACARLLLQKQWRVILAVRNLSRGETAKQELLSQFPNADVSLRLLDLAGPSSIKTFCDGLIQDGVDVDAFYCNAGIYRVPFQTCFGSLESQMAVNFVANLWLYRLLKDYFHSLGHAVKFILTSSVVARFEQVGEADLYGENPYKKARAYAKSKLAVNHLYRYLCQEEAGQNVLPLLVHPGIVYTPLIEKAYPNQKLLLCAKRFMRAFFNSPEKAALSTLFLLQDEIQEPCFAMPRGIGHSRGFPCKRELFLKNCSNHKDIVSRASAIIDGLEK